MQQIGPSSLSPCSTDKHDERIPLSTTECLLREFDDDIVLNDVGCVPGDHHIVSNPTVKPQGAAGDTAKAKAAF